MICPADAALRGTGPYRAALKNGQLYLTLSTQFSVRAARDGGGAVHLCRQYDIR
jgi:hypothetical protein